jgi:hypothetical protein
MLTDQAEPRELPHACHYLGRALDARPTSNFELYTHHFGDDLSTKPKAQKTYRRFLGTIFFGGFRALVMAASQVVAKDKNTKMWKNGNVKHHFFSRPPPVFLPKRPKNGLLFLSVLIYGSTGDLLKRCG